MTKLSKLIVFSGAGFSAESGIPVFRGDGLWDKHSIADVCDIRTFPRNRKIVEQFYDGLRLQMGNAVPHEGYRILKDILPHYEAKVFTSNIDDLHEKAGIDCVHVHGKISDIVCLECGVFSDIGTLTCAEAHKLGLIRHTSGCAKENLKPGITFYYEDYDRYPGIFRLKEELRTLEKDDIVLTIGSSLSVIPVDYWVRHTRCHRYNINPTHQAGYKRSTKFWRNIYQNSGPGLRELETILEGYRKGIDQST